MFDLVDTFLALWTISGVGMYSIPQSWARACEPWQVKVVSD